MDKDLLYRFFEGHASLEVTMFAKANTLRQVGCRSS